MTRRPDPDDLPLVWQIASWAPLALMWAYVALLALWAIDLPPLPWSGR